MWNPGAGAVFTKELLRCSSPVLLAWGTVAVQVLAPSLFAARLWVRDLTLHCSCLLNYGKQLCLLPILKRRFGELNPGKHSAQRLWKGFTLSTQSMVAIVIIGVCYFYPSPQGPFRPHVRVWHIWLEDFLLPGLDPELLVLSPLFLCYSTWVSGSARVWPFVPVWGQLCSFISVLCFQSPFLCWLRGRPLAIRAASHPHWLLGSAQG